MYKIVSNALIRVSVFEVGDDNIHGASPYEAFRFVKMPSGVVAQAKPRWSNFFVEFSISRFENMDSFFRYVFCSDLSKASKRFGYVSSGKVHFRFDPNTRKVKWETCKDACHGSSPRVYQNSYILSPGLGSMINSSYQRLFGHEATRSYKEVKKKYYSVHQAYADLHRGKSARSVGYVSEIDSAYAVLTNPSLRVNYAKVLFERGDFSNFENELLFLQDLTPCNPYTVKLTIEFSMLTNRGDELIQYLSRLTGVSQTIDGLVEDFRSSLVSSNPSISLNNDMDLDVVEECIGVLEENASKLHLAYQKLVMGFSERLVGSEEIELLQTALVGKQYFYSRSMLQYIRWRSYRPSVRIYENATRNLLRLCPPQDLFVGQTFNLSFVDVDSQAYEDTQEKFSTFLSFVETFSCASREKLSKRVSSFYVVKKKHYRFYGTTVDTSASAAAELNRIERIGFVRAREDTEFSLGLKDLDMHPFKKFFILLHTAIGRYNSGDIVSAITRFSGCLVFGNELITREGLLAKSLDFQMVLLGVLALQVGAFLRGGRYKDAMVAMNRYNRDFLFLMTRLRGAGDKYKLHTVKAQVLKRDLDRLFQVYIDQNDLVSKDCSLGPVLRSLSNREIKISYVRGVLFGPEKMSFESVRCVGVDKSKLRFYIIMGCGNRSERLCSFGLSYGSKTRDLEFPSEFKMEKVILLKDNVVFFGTEETNPKSVGADVDTDAAEGMVQFPELGDNHGQSSLVVQSSKKFLTCDKSSQFKSIDSSQDDFFLVDVIGKYSDSVYYCIGNGLLSKVTLIVFDLNRAYLSQSFTFPRYCSFKKDNLFYYPEREYWLYQTEKKLSFFSISGTDVVLKKEMTVSALNGSRYVKWNRLVQNYFMFGSEKKIYLVNMNMLDLIEIPLPNNHCLLEDVHPPLDLLDSRYLPVFASSDGKDCIVIIDLERKECIVSRVFDLPESVTGIVVIDDDHFGVLSKSGKMHVFLMDRGKHCIEF